MPRRKRSGGSPRQKICRRRHNDSCLKIKDIRRLSRIYGYREVQLNEESCVIAFTQESQHTRINIYYTTGTVSTSITHPRRGKSQLFRRKVSFEQLADIFADPRVHTGKGYFRSKRKGLNWTCLQTEAPLCPTSLRWKYVASETGVFPSFAQVMRFIQDFNFTFQGPGALCMHDCWWIKRSPLVGAYFATEGNDTARAIADIPTCRCASGQRFYEGNKHKLENLTRQFRSLRRDTRVLLADWYISRFQHSRIFDRQMQPIVPKDFHRVYEAHVAYGMLTLPPDGKICYYHGEF